MLRPERHNRIDAVLRECTDVLLRHGVMGVVVITDGDYSTGSAVFENGDPIAEDTRTDYSVTQASYICRAISAQVEKLVALAHEHHETAVTMFAKMASKRGIKQS